MVFKGKPWASWANRVGAWSRRSLVPRGAIPQGVWQAGQVWGWSASPLLWRTAHTTAGPASWIVSEEPTHLEAPPLLSCPWVQLPTHRGRSHIQALPRALGQGEGTGLAGPSRGTGRGLSGCGGAPRLLERGQRHTGPRWRWILSEERQQERGQTACSASPTLHRGSRAPRKRVPGVGRTPGSLGRRDGCSWRRPAGLHPTERSCPTHSPTSSPGLSPRWPCSASLGDPSPGLGSGPRVGRAVRLLRWPQAPPGHPCGVRPWSQPPGETRPQNTRAPFACGTACAGLSRP